MSQHFRNFDQLPAAAYVRLSELVQLPNRPPQPVPLPFSGPTLWRKVREGTFPRPVKLGPRVTAWSVGQVRAWLALQQEEGA